MCARRYQKACILGLPVLCLDSGRPQVNNKWYIFKVLLFYVYLQLLFFCLVHGEHHLMFESGRSYNGFSSFRWGMSQLDARLCIRFHTKCKKYWSGLLFTSKISRRDHSEDMNFFPPLFASGLLWHWLSIVILLQLVLLLPLRLFHMFWDAYGFPSMCP